MAHKYGNFLMLCALPAHNRHSFVGIGSQPHGLCCPHRQRQRGGARRKESTIRRISRFATTVAISGGLALAGLGLAAGTAQADPFAAQPHSWCPGHALPFNNIQWDMGVCHTWYTVPFGQGNVRMVDLHGNPLDSFISADLPAPMLTPPPPARRSAARGEH
jgi:hypothetical protein